MPDSPFLTVVTRCYKRPHFLQNNIRSLKTQTDKDYEQVFIIDRTGQGLAAADKALNTYKYCNNGTYVMVLDDDDLVVDSKFITEIKIIAKKHNPDVIIWRGDFKHFIGPLLDTNWGKWVQKGKIGSFNYAIKNNVYNDHIHVCASGVTGDFDFIQRVLYHTSSVIWVDRVFVATQIKSKGRVVEAIEERDGFRILRKNRRKL